MLLEYSLKYKLMLNVNANTYIFQNQMTILNVKLQATDTVLL
jgi:hypothetical protein